ncbi:MAG: hypothetical protein KC431_24970, partial [Myxococcales bacterium]|nr:hypothetical protein [Myxococcales bacterium]
VVHVDADGNWMGGGEVFSDVGAALDAHADEPELVVFVHQKAGAYQENILIDAAHPLVALRAAAGESPLIEDDLAQATVAVTDGSVLYLHGLRIKHSVQGGISVDGGKLWASATQFTADTSGTAVVNNGGYIDLQNCFLTSNANNTNALHVDGSMFNVSYTTIVAGFTFMNNVGRALSCSGGSGGSLRNSLLITQSDAIEFECPGLAPVSSAFETMIPGNTAIGLLMDASWFDDLPSGDLHLTDVAPMALSTAATWQPGDPPTDIDGEARPSESGPDYAGADRP